MSKETNPSQTWKPEGVTAAQVKTVESLLSPSQSVEQAWIRGGVLSVIVYPDRKIVKVYPNGEPFDA